MVGLNKKIKAVESHNIFSEFLNAAFVCSAQMILKFGIGTVAVVGASLLLKNEINIVTFFMYLLVVSRMYEPLQIALQNFSALIATDTQCERMDEILSHYEQTGSDELTNKNYDIEFKNVRFSYEDGETVLKDVSFVVKQGEVTALIGPSGGGKTTVSRLAARFWDIEKGLITVGGMDISKIDPEKLLSMYSIVFQDVTLFNNTVLENIRIGKKEATASLDVDNESVIQEAISDLIKDKTVLIIAHRMRTVDGADKIVVLKNGKVAESDTPAKLKESNRIYSHMISVQMQTENWKMA